MGVTPEPGTLQAVEISLNAWAGIQEAARIQAESYYRNRDAFLIARGWHVGRQGLWHKAILGKASHHGKTAEAAFQIERNARGDSNQDGAA